MRPGVTRNYLFAGFWLDGSYVNLVLSLNVSSGEVVIIKIIIIIVIIIIFIIKFYRASCRALKML